jgi:hypothetical protein
MSSAIFPHIQKLRKQHLINLCIPWKAKIQRKLRKDIKHIGIMQWKIVIIGWNDITNSKTKFGYAL